VNAHNFSDLGGGRGPLSATVTSAAKSTLRAQLRRRRRALDAAQQAQAAAGLAAQLQRLPAFARARRIAFYLARDGEIDSGAALQQALDRGAQCYAPVIGDDGDKTLRFAAVTVHSEFRAGRFGIKEPVVDAGELIAARDLDLVLVPLVGFDTRGNRLGMGGGFYDATFARDRGDGNGNGTGAGPVLVGLAHETQRIATIAADAWDIPLTAVVTDRRVYHCAAALPSADIDNTVAATVASDNTVTATVASDNTVADKFPRANNPEAVPCATG